jgi:hypothetical protein
MDFPVRRDDKTRAKSTDREVHRTSDNMHRQILISCLPCLAAMVVSCGVLVLLARLSGSRVDLRQLKRLHGDEGGAVQSLSFVLTLPVFIVIMLFIVQLSQLTIAKIVVEYASFAATRSAIVWIPANLGADEEGYALEGMNQIAGLAYEGDQMIEGKMYSLYTASEGGGPKFNRIHLAAATACLPICPSRDVGAGGDNPAMAAADPLTKAYLAISPQSTSNTKIPERIRNKLAYALDNTEIVIEIAHKDTEPPLVWHDMGPYPEEFDVGEIGWQDQVAVSVTHHFALLPGPARFLARSSTARPGTSPGEARGSDDVAQSIDRRGEVWVRSINASTRMSNEGEKPLLPYIQKIFTGG